MFLSLKPSSRFARFAAAGLLAAGLQVSPAGAGAPEHPAANALPQNCDGVAAAKNVAPAKLPDTAIVVGTLEPNDTDDQPADDNPPAADDQDNGQDTDAACKAYADAHDVRVLVDTAELAKAKEGKYLVVRFNVPRATAANTANLPYFEYKGPFQAQDQDDGDDSDNLSHPVTEISLAKTLTPEALKAVNDAHGFIMHLTPSP